VVVFLVALVETILRLAEIVYAPFYALFLVGPAALLVEASLGRIRQTSIPVVAVRHRKRLE
jgi:enediyne biosynthesis protein E5